MPNIQIEISGFDKLISIAEKYPKVAQEEIGTGIFRSLTRIWGEEKLEAPFGVSGQLRDRWNIVTSPFEGKLVAGTKYARWVHDGTRPHMPPAEYLQQWADKHGIPVFLVQRAIARRGTKENKFLERAAKNAKSGVDQEFASALNRIVDIISE